MKTGESTCENCTLKQFVYVKPQLIYQKQLPILFVGQAPGKVETITGQPFTGPAGKMLWRIMTNAGIAKLRVDITNVAKCAPPEDRKPTDQEITCCKPFLKQDIHITQPKLIVALGDVACKTLAGSARVMSIRGSLLPLLPWFEYNCQVLCALHPSFVMRQRQWLDIATQDMIKAVQFLIGKPIEVGEEPELVTEIDVYQFTRYLEEAAKFPTAVDTETTGLNPRTDTVIGASLCYEPNRAIAFDLAVCDPKWEVFKRYLEDPNAPKVTQNGQFDIAMLDSHNIEVKGLAFDTRLAEHLLSSDLPGSLEFLRSKYTDIKPYKPSAAERKKIALWTRDRRLNYGCLDALTTFRVYQKQLALLGKENLKVMQEIEIPVAYVVNAMEKRGVMVDTEKLQQMEDAFGPQAEAIKAKHFDSINVNPNSPKQLSQLFGVPSTGEESLNDYIKHGHVFSELMEALLEYRALQKTYSVYLDGVRQRLEYGRIHTHYKSGGTGTGRLSSENPNLQNVPKALRLIYVPDPGNVFVEADYSQLELRAIAVIADEKTMLSELANGMNTHHSMGEIIFGKKWHDLTDKERLWTKNVVFGTAYGRGPTAIARQFGITIKLAEQWQNACIKKYSGLTRYKVKQESVFHSTGKCYTPFGRSRPILTVTQALNTPIQSSGSDICLTSLILLHNEGFKLSFTVHDSITIQVEKQLAMDQAKVMKAIMERPIPEMNNNRFPVKLSTGTNWKDLEEMQI